MHSWGPEKFLFSFFFLFNTSVSENPCEFMQQLVFFFEKMNCMFSLF